MSLLRVWSTQDKEGISTGCNRLWALHTNLCGNQETSIRSPLGEPSDSGSNRSVAEFGEGAPGAVQTRGGEAVKQEGFAEPFDLLRASGVAGRGQSEGLHWGVRWPGHHGHYRDGKGWSEGLLWPG